MKQSHCIAVKSHSKDRKEEIVHCIPSRRVLIFFNLKLHSFACEKLYAQLGVCYETLNTVKSYCDTALIWHNINILYQEC